MNELQQPQHSNSEEKPDSIPTLDTTDNNSHEEIQQADRFDDDSIMLPPPIP